MRTFWYVYMVRCVNGAFYTGSTVDLQRRVAEHNKGKGARYTRARGPVILVYREAFRDRSSALRRENEIKRLTHKEKSALLQTASSTTA